MLEKSNIVEGGGKVRYAKHLLSVAVALPFLALRTFNVRGSRAMLHFKFPTMPSSKVSAVTFSQTDHLLPPAIALFLPGSRLSRSTTYSCGYLKLPG